MSTRGNYTEGTVLNITCLAGFAMVGKVAITCTANGAWSNNNHVCKQIGKF